MAGSLYKRARPKNVNWCIVMKYVVSGIGPGKSGVGRLMKVLRPKYESQGFKVICKRETCSIRSFLIEKNYFNAVAEIPLRFISSFIFRFKVRLIKKSHVVFIHPQTAGFDLLFTILKKNNTSLYVMDNSFFCIESYNTNPITKKECLKCVGVCEPESACQPFPVKISKNLNLKYLDELKASSEKINFLVQNSLQLKLLKAHFGEHIKAEIVGMDTQETLTSAKIIDTFNSELKYKVDVVYHGAAIIPKGLLYVIQLANLLPEFIFLIPDNTKSIEKVVGDIIPANVVCKKMSWETGLRDYVVGSKVVINPSVWSAPIEGALLKSAAFNKNVATVVTEFGYENEIENIINHIRLDQDVEIASAQLRDALARCN